MSDPGLKILHKILNEKSKRADHGAQEQVPSSSRPGGCPGCRSSAPGQVFSPCTPVPEPNKRSNHPQLAQLSSHSRSNVRTRRFLRHPPPSSPQFPSVYPCMRLSRGLTCRRAARLPRSPIGPRGWQSRPAPCLAVSLRRNERGPLRAPAPAKASAPAAAGGGGRLSAGREALPAAPSGAGEELR